MNSPTSHSGALRVAGVALFAATFGCVFQIPATTGLPCNTDDDCDAGEECFTNVFDESICRSPGSDEPTSPTDPSDPTDPTDPTSDPSGSETDGDNDTTICGSPSSDRACASPDGPGSGPGECSLIVQDCDGGKCIPWDSNSDSVDDTTICAPAGSAQLGQSCEYTDGVDDCDVGLVCSGGFCHETCGCSLSNPTCTIPNGTCDTSSAVSAVCRTECDPLDVGACPSGFVCISLGESLPFLCYGQAGGGGEFGETCDFANSCPPGSACVTAEALDYCSGEFCCAPTCDVANGVCADEFDGCLRFHTEGTEANACGEDVGICTSRDSIDNSCPDCTLLLHMDEATFADASPSQYPISQVGIPTVSTDGRFSGALSTSGGSLRIPGASFQAFADDFTLDFWVRTTATEGSLWSQGDEQTLGGFRVVMGPVATSTAPPGHIGVSAFAQEPWGGWISSPSPVNDGLYHHIAVVRSASVIVLFVDGERVEILSNVEGNLHFGADIDIGIGEAGSMWASEIDELRVVHGVAKWTSDFTPPSAPYTVSADDGHVVFVTSATDMGNMNGVANADAVCQNAATNAGLDGTFYAWLSDDSTSPTVRFMQSKLPYILVNGTIVANNWGDLVDGSLVHPIDLDEFGNPGPADSQGRVWTGTTPTGVGTGQHCSNWFSDTASGSIGIWDASLPDYTSPEDWTQAFFAQGVGSSVTSCGTPFAIYCFQQ